MKRLFTHQNNLIYVSTQNHIFTEISQSMKVKYICVCCSNVLLRHASLGRAYWRCSYCYQEMPV